MKKNIGIIGTGSWGLALSLAINRSESSVKIWFNSEEKYNLVKKDRVSNYLPGIKIPKKIKLTLMLDEVTDCDYVFLVTPSQFVRENLNLMKSKKIPKNLVICSKGIEKKSNKLMSQVVNDIFPLNKPIILSGPNFANEVARNLPTAFVLSSSNLRKIKILGKIISSKNFRPYFNKDIIGTQIGGAFKNVIAIACGIVVGKGLGENAKSSLLTRGLSEIMLLGKKMNANEKTFRGLSGLGDLNLSCNSLKSRNMALGYKLGKNLKIRDLVKENLLSEGLNSCEAICKLGEFHKVNLPICNSIRNIIGGSSINSAIKSLLSRPLQMEK